jgi:hypothetical protein
MAPSASQNHPVIQQKLQGAKNIKASYGHVYDSVCAQTVAGFTAHTFNSDYTQLTTTFYNNLGGIVNQFTSDKNGVWTAVGGGCVTN